MYIAERKILIHTMRNGCQERVATCGSAQERRLGESGIQNAVSGEGLVLFCETMIDPSVPLVGKVCCRVRSKVIVGEQRGAPRAADVRLGQQRHHFHRRRTERGKGVV